MIVQITRTRDECFLIKELLPIWKKYADGFIFISDKSTDDTISFLHENKKEYNILEVLETDPKAEMKVYETHGRQKLFDTAYKYTNKIVCLDSDEYLDGLTTKEQLEQTLDRNQDTVFLLHWEQYTSKNQIRVDGVWADPYQDRIGSYTYKAEYNDAFSHSSHVPKDNPRLKTVHVDPKHLFIAHLQWLDKKWVGVKQYYWKVWDYVNNLQHNISIIDRRLYDASVNNFQWLYKDFHTPLKIREDIYQTQNLEQNYKLLYIKEQTRKYNIPNLGDWGLGIYEYCIQ
jgi:hypothetical protein